MTLKSRKVGGQGRGKGILPQVTAKEQHVQRYRKDAERGMYEHGKRFHLARTWDNKNNAYIDLILIVS